MKIQFAKSRKDVRALCSKLLRVGLYQDDPCFGRWGGIADCYRTELGYNHLYVHSIEKMTVAYYRNIPVGVALIDREEVDGVEVRRCQIFVRPKFRSRGIGASLLENLRIRKSACICHETTDLEFFTKRGMKSERI